MKEGTDNVAVGLCFKDFSYWSGYSSVGLNVAARLTAEELRNAYEANHDLFWSIANRISDLSESSAYSVKEAEKN